MLDDAAFSFRDLVKPGDGAEQALRSGLDAAETRDRRTAKPHWVYSGAAQLLKEHGTFFRGRELPDMWASLVGLPSNCHANSLTAALRAPELRYFTGLYMVGAYAMSHSWCVDAEGVVELTFPTLPDPSGLPMILHDATGEFTGRHWIPPEHWVYVGVEYDTDFAASHRDLRGLPILDPLALDTMPLGMNSYRHDEELPMWATPYSRGGFPVTAAPTLEWEEEDPE